MLQNDVKSHELRDELRPWYVCCGEEYRGEEEMADCRGCLLLTRDGEEETAVLVDEDPVCRVFGGDIRLGDGDNLVFRGEDGALVILTVSAGLP